MGRTALGVAYVRAQESRRHDRLFDDPYAQAFVDAAPGHFPATRGEAERALPGLTALREAWPGPLVAGGFEPRSTTAWLVEGLLIYLSAEEATRLLTNITALSGPDSHRAFEHGTIANNAVFGQAQAMPAMREYIALWKGGLGQDAPAWLTGHGWRMRTHDTGGLAESYRRPAPAGASGAFLTAILSTSH